MKHSAYIYNELKEISPFLAELEKTNVFSVPENYFSGLCTQILNRINEYPSYVLPASETPLLSVPDGYFANLASNILQKIKNLENNEAAEELRQICPILYSIQNKNVFTVPEGYFKSLPGILLNVVRPQAKVVAMKKRNMVWNSAVAAMLAGVMAISALWISNISSHEIPVTATNTAIPADIKESLQYKNEQQINEGISDLSDADIVTYLEVTGSTADDEMLASGIPETDLPDEQDYLTDENTLQIFLGKTGSKNNQN